jgi:hypothetical protein
MQQSKTSHTTLPNQATVMMETDAATNHETIRASIWKAKVLLYHMYGGTGKNGPICKNSEVVADGIERYGG